MKPLACQNLTKNHEADFRDLSQFDKKLFEQNHELIFKPIKFWKLPPPKKPDFIEPKLLLKTKTLICKTQNANLKTQLIFEKPT